MKEMILRGENRKEQVQVLRRGVLVCISCYVWNTEYLLGWISMSKSASQIRIAPSHETGQKGGGKRIKPDLE